jgi:NAD(P)-dependent dehydrogenase (short-subunit alcohol dehydrogenase family)
MGLAVARRLAGGRLLLADSSGTRLEAALTALRGEGHSAEGHTMDVSDRGAVEKLAEAAAVGHIDAVVHTAGVSPVMATSRQIYEVDLLGTAHVIDAFLDVAGPGTPLVCIASMAGHFASLPADFERHLAGAPTGQLLQHPRIDLDSADTATAYMVAKRGNHLRVQAAAHAWGRKGARLNTISPGVISTPMGRQELDGPMGAYIPVHDRSLRSAPGGHPGRRHRCRGLPGRTDSSFITGNDILVDGGAVSAQRWNTGTPA